MHLRVCSDSFVMHLVCFKHLSLVKYFLFSGKIRYAIETFTADYEVNLFQALSFHSSHSYFHQFGRWWL